MTVPTSAPPRYHLDRLLGRGAFGEVYLARHASLDGLRAIKVLRRDMPTVGSTTFDVYRERFDLEFWLGEKLKHPNVILVYDMVSTDDALYAIMEFAPNGSLADLLEHEGAQPVERVIRLVADTARGLAALHAVDAVHRDVKPANILIGADGSAKVADLGLAQVPGRQGSGRSWRGSGSGPHPGTPDYMSPEHRHPDALSPSSDVYSLGCVGFELLTGRVWKQARRDADCVRDLRPEVPEWLDRVVMRMLMEAPGLSKSDRADPLKRYVDMAAVLAALSTGDRSPPPFLPPQAEPTTRPSAPATASPQPTAGTTVASPTPRPHPGPEPARPEPRRPIAVPSPVASPATPRNGQTSRITETPNAAPSSSRGLLVIGAVLIGGIVLLLGAATVLPLVGDVWGSLFPSPAAPPDSHQEPQRPRPQAQEPTRRPIVPTPDIAPTRLPPPQAASDPAADVRRYWSLLGSGQSNQAWNLLSTGFQQRNHDGDIDHYIAGWGRQARPDIQRADTLSQAGDTATVEALVRFVGTSGKGVDQLITHDMILGADGSWLIDRVPNVRTP